MGIFPYCSTINKILHKRKACLLTRNFQFGNGQIGGNFYYQNNLENAEYACKIKLYQF